MVASDKKQAREEFGVVFNAELTRIGAPIGRGRVIWVHNKLKDRFQQLVSYEQVRKYVSGKDIPDRAHLRIICKRLELNWLRFETGSHRDAGADVLLSALIKAWQLIKNDAVRREILDFVHFKASLAASPEVRGDDPQSGTTDRPD